MKFFAEMAQIFEIDGVEFKVLETLERFEQKPEIVNSSLRVLAQIPPDSSDFVPLLFRLSQRYSDAEFLRNLLNCLTAYSKKQPLTIHEVREFQSLLQLGFELCQTSPVKLLQQLETSFRPSREFSKFLIDSKIVEGLVQALDSPEARESSLMTLSSLRSEKYRKKLIEIGLLKKLTSLRDERVSYETLVLCTVLTNFLTISQD